MINKIKIINILYHIPPYENYPSDNPPQVHWDLPDGKWVAIWGYDIPNQFGNEILKRSSDFEYEVWQPDLRADKTYVHTFESGVVHKLFPAQAVRRRHGLKRVNDVFSRALIDELRRSLDGRTVLHLNAVSGSINEKILQMFPQTPKVINFHSLISSMPIQQIFRLRKNILNNFQYIARHCELRRNRNVVYTYNNSRNITYLKKYPNRGIERSFTSIDFDYWVPGDKRLAKTSFDITESTFVFSMASRLNSHKQVDRIIKVLTKLDKENNYDFCLLIAGNGEDSYINYLQKTAEELTGKGKMRFVGYIRGNDLLTLYQASDLFISASISEGGPASVIKAIACQTPVFCTRSGGVDDSIAEHGGGYLADWNDYPGWESIFKRILMRQSQPEKFNREMAEKLFGWDTAAKKYIEIYKRLVSMN
ncbi:MAG: glycosyltransferase [Thermodesulfovibrionales bacterium]|nr:glycosyltransferase [Thermodesulfovibrionales bacterium]